METIPTTATPFLSYALFHCNPLLEPPFTLELGFNDASVKELTECAHIPEALEKMEALCQEQNISKSPNFTLIYPIYLEAMDTDSETTMHYVAGLILDEATKNNWQFGRIGGYTGKTTADFI